MSEARSPAQHEHLRVGQPFNPFRMFTGIFIPKALCPIQAGVAGVQDTEPLLRRRRCTVNKSTAALRSWRVRLAFHRAKVQTLKVVVGNVVHTHLVCAGRRSSQDFPIAGHAERHGPSEA